MNHNYSIESTHILSWTRKYPMSMLFLLFSISFQHSWKIFLALCAPEIFRTNRVKKYCVLARTPFATMQENKKMFELFLNHARRFSQNCRTDRTKLWQFIINQSAKRERRKKATEITAQIADKWNIEQRKDWCSTSTSFVMNDLSDINMMAILECLLFFWAIFESPSQQLNVIYQWIWLRILLWR